MKKNIIKKLLISIMITIVSFFSILSQTFAAPSTITTTANPTLLPGFVNGTRFHIIPMTDGTGTYSLDLNKTEPRNHTLHLVGEMDSGIAYLLENGYPKKSIVQDTNKDYYITQTAIWWYLDNTTGSHNLTNEFKTTGSDPNGLRPYIQDLTNKAMNARSKGYVKPSLSMNTANTKLELSQDKKYYISKDIKISGTAISSGVTLSLSSAPKGTEIVSTDNVSKTNFKVGDSFRVRVPASSITDKSVNFKMDAVANSTVNKAYKYRPTNDSLQSLTPTVLYPEEGRENATLKFQISSSVVKIIKLDKVTNKPLAGAELVLKDEKGSVIASWTSTNEAYKIMNLGNGTYTLEEKKAPTGYKLSDEKVTFTVTDKDNDLTVKMVNTPKSNVVNILKIDKSTEKPLAGATLVVRDAKNNVVARFVTTEKAYVLQDLADGSYTVEEESAPLGYMKSEEKKTFIIDDEHTSHQIVMENYPEVIVPPTSSSTMMYILGSIILLAGIGLVYYYEKYKKA